MDNKSTSNSRTPTSRTATPASTRQTATPSAKSTTATSRTATPASTRQSATPTAKSTTSASTRTATTRQSAAEQKSAQSTQRTAATRQTATPAAKSTTATSRTATPASTRTATTRQSAAEQRAASSRSSSNARAERAAVAADTDVKRAARNKDKNARSSSGATKARGGAAAEADGNVKKKAVIITCAVILLCVAIIVTVVIVLHVRKKNALPTDVFKNTYSTTTKVGYAAEYLDTVERKIPATTENEGRSSVGYPTYGYTLNAAMGTDSDKVALRNAIIGESSYLTSSDTANAGGGGYNSIDADGNLCNNLVPTGRRLYKHTGAVGMYLGDVSDDEPAVVKRLTIKPRGYRSYSVTGLYAPAGEVVKVQISEADLAAVGELKFYIGQALYNGQANNIWATKNQMNRMPHVLNTLIVNANRAVLEDGVYTAYIGSFLGGPIYISNTNVQFTVTISGAVRYSHFILGYTSPEEFAENSKSSAPYFDLEVWEYGVLHSGPKQYAAQLSYDDIYSAAIMWDKIALVSTRISSQGVVFLYDPFVAAGAAVAFPGRSSVNCPMGWMSGSLNYDSFVTSGSWGNMHEYNHNFQGWGMGDGGEVTNNALSLVEYSLFTDISSARKVGASGDGMGGWNRYTSASFALDQITAGKFENGTKGLAAYATVLHSFGQDLFIKTAQTSRSQTVDKWAAACSEATGHNFTYYVQSMLGHAVSDTALTDEQKAYPMFVPVASTYQTGRRFAVGDDTHEITTMRPYVIEQGVDFDFNFLEYGINHDIDGKTVAGSLVVPDGFTYRVKSVFEPEYGAVTKKADNIYTYTPDGSNRSGKIYVTLEINKTDNAFDVEDVELVLEFQPKIGKPNQIDQVTYTYTADTIYTTVEQAYADNYEGYADVTRSYVNYPSKNMNGNAQVWFPADNTVTELSGKILITETAKYRFDLRATYSNLYISLDNGRTYALAANVKSYVATHNVTDNIPLGCKYYTDYELNKDDWVYFKIVTLNNKALLDADASSKGRSYADLGMGKFEVPGGTIDEDEDTEDYVPPTATVKTLIVTSAYRVDYEPSTGSFESEYFYLREYSYDYDNAEPIAVKQTPLFSQYTPWDSTDTYKIENIFDDDETTYIHNSKYHVTETPFVVEVELENEITANRLVFFGTKYNNNAKTYLPKAYKVWIGDGTGEWELVAEATTSVVSNQRVTVDFDGMHTFRYYKVEVSDTHSTAAYKYIALDKIEFYNAISLHGGKQISPDDASITYKGSWSVEPGLCTFGHILCGKNKATAEFEFTGTHVAIKSMRGSGYGSFTVYIDGRQVDTVSLDGSGVDVVYVSSELSDEKTHTVQIRCTSGTANIDSIIVW
ncbi:MAG: M60 family metallopeptidase [Roseburia sp.]|nr:M60 family metallopeptidase [Roseburia sp.]